MDLKAVAVMMLICLSAASLASGADVPTITVVGEGSVTVPADVVYISVSASSDNENVTEAYAESSEKLNGSLDAIRDSCAGKCEILQGYSTGIQSMKVCNKIDSNESICMNRTIVTVSASIRLESPDQSTIESIKRTAESTGTYAAVTGYALSDATAAKNEARKKAVENARSTAEAMVGAAGGRLGKIVDITESPLYLWDIPFGIFGPTVEPSTTEPGMVEVKTTVMVTYEIVS